jgi:hypothetical protein
VEKGWSTGGADTKVRNHQVRYGIVETQKIYKGEYHELLSMSGYRSRV